jgi:GNAT superfamily N-acetyltransferase
MLNNQVDVVARAEAGVTFRRAARADTEAIASLHTRSWRDAYRTIMPDWYLDGPIEAERLGLWQSRFSTSDADRLYVLLAESDGKPVGFVCVLLEEEPRRGACLDNLHILPGSRGKGIGRQLFARATQWVMLTEPGLPIHLWVFEANVTARRFYDALGGAVVELQKKEVLKGIEIPSVLYVWRDLEELLNNLTRGSTRTADFDRWAR